MSKILIVGQLPPPFHGSNVMAEITLKTLNDSNLGVYFLDKSFGKSIDTIGKISIRKLLRVPKLIFDIILIRVFRKPNICLYFIAVGKLAFIVDALLLTILWICGIPYILRFGGKGYLKLYNDGWIWNKIVKNTLKNALGGIILGKNMNYDVNFALPDSRLVTVPNGIKDHRKCLERKKGKAIKILFLANLVPTKGPLEFLIAAKHVLEKHQNVSFILAGADSSKNFTNYLKDYINKKGINKFIKMYGRVDGVTKNQLYLESDMFVFPSYFRYEVFANVNVEAMSWGLPVITSNEGAIPEIVKDSVSGFIVNPKNPKEIADKIILLIEDENLRLQMGNKAREIYEEKYTIEKYGKNLKDALQHLYRLRNDYR